MLPNCCSELSDLALLSVSDGYEANSHSHNPQLLTLPLYLVQLREWSDEKFADCVFFPLPAVCVGLGGEVIVCVCLKMIDSHGSVMDVVMAGVSQQMGISVWLFSLESFTTTMSIRLNTLFIFLSLCWRGCVCVCVCVLLLWGFWAVDSNGSAHFPPHLTTPLTLLWILVTVIQLILITLLHLLVRLIRHVCVCVYGCVVVFPASLLYLRTSHALLLEGFQLSL